MKQISLAKGRGPTYRWVEFVIHWVMGKARLDLGGNEWKPLILRSAVCGLRSAVAVGVLLCGATSARGQVACVPDGCYRYRVIDLGRISALPGDLQLPPNGNVTFGLNDNGVLVWARLDPSTAAPRAMARIAFAATGPVGTYDLHALGGLSDAMSVATDVNEDGWIGGGSGSSLPEPRGNDCQARVWQFGGYSGGSSVPTSSAHPTDILVSSTLIETSCTSLIEMVNDSSTPEVMGMVTIPCSDESNCEDFRDPFYGFRRPASGGAGVADGFQPGPSSAEAFAFGSVGMATLGYDNNSPNPLCEPVTQETECAVVQADAEAMQWSTSAGAILDEFESPGVGASQVRDTLDSGECVGAGHVTFGESCGWHAAFWETASSSIEDVGAVYAAMASSTARSKAEAVAEHEGKILVTGGDPVNLEGILWERVGDSWCAANLNDISLGGPSSSGTLVSQIFWGHDINSGGFILAHGPTSELDGQHVFLLTCPLDFDGSMDIGSGDLALLIGAWGDPGGFADVNFDNDVGAADLSMLLGAWSSPSMCEIGPAHDLGACAPNSLQLQQGMTVEAAVNVLGFASVDSFVLWCGQAEDPELTAAGTWLSCLVISGAGGGN